MHQFAIDPTVPKADLYRELLGALDALTADEPDPIANMANAAALIREYLPDLNWVGFYRAIGDELVLGPFQGKVACIRIAIGEGVCGTAAATRETQVVEDVAAFPGHIACDSASASELVVPIVVEGRAGRHAPGMAADARGAPAPARLIGVLDLDSPTSARFDAEDAAGCEALIAVLGPRIAG